jgi:hypothetical protein
MAKSAVYVRVSVFARFRQTWRLELTDCGAHNPVLTVCVAARRTNLTARIEGLIPEQIFQLKRRCVPTRWLRVCRVSGNSEGKYQRR